MFAPIAGVALLEESQSLAVNGGRRRSRQDSLLNLDINVSAANALAINRGLQIAIIVNSPGASITQLLLQDADAAAKS